MNSLTFSLPFTQSLKRHQKTAGRIKPSVLWKQKGFHTCLTKQRFIKGGKLEGLLMWVQLPLLVRRVWFCPPPHLHESAGTCSRRKKSSFSPWRNHVRLSASSRSYKQWSDHQVSLPNSHRTIEPTPRTARKRRCRISSKKWRKDG